MLHHGSTSIEELEAMEATPTGSLYRGEKRECKVQIAINTPAILAGLESFAAGSEYDFAYWYDEVHIVVSGHATIECTLPPFHQETHTIRVGPGDMYQIDNGSRFWFKVDDGEPFVHYMTISPNPFYEAMTTSES